MRKLPILLFVLVLSLSALFVNGQTKQATQSVKSTPAKTSKSIVAADSSSADWVAMMRDPKTNIHDVQKAFYAWYSKKHPGGEKEEEKEKKEKLKHKKGTIKEGAEDEDDEAYEIFKRWELFNMPRVDALGNHPDFNKIGLDYENYLKTSPVHAPSNSHAPARLTPGPTTANWSYGGNTSIPTNSTTGYGGNGRVNRVRVMPGNNNSIFACTASGGLWKTTNGGTSWSTNTDQLGDLTTSDVAINPMDTNIMYLATGDGDGSQSIYPDPATIGILKSYNGGVTWVATSLAYTMSASGADLYTVNEIIIDPTDTSTVLAATSFGIYRSTNSGGTWTLATGTGTGNAIWFHNIVFHPKNANIVYATTSNVYNPVGTAVGGGFYRSTNNGASWSHIGSGLPSAGTASVDSAEGMAVAVSAADTSDVFVLATRETDYDFLGLYVSTNDGVTFTEQDGYPTTPNVLGRAQNGNDYGTGQGWYDLTLAVSQTSIDTIIVGGINVWESKNEGVAWTLSGYWYTGNDTYVHADVHDIEAIPGTNSKDFILGCDGGVFRTTTGGSTWVNLSSNLANSEQYCVGAAKQVNDLWITGWQDNGTNVSTAPWEQTYGGDGMDCFIDWSNDATWYAQADNTFLRSTNSGGAWTQINTGLETGEWNYIWTQDPQTNKTLYCCIENVWKSVNQGTAWTKIGTWGTANTFGSAMAVDSANVNYIYAGTVSYSGGTGVLEVTENGGTSWTNITGSGWPNSIAGIAVNSKSPSHIWVTMSGYTSGDQVFYSTNSGTSWTNISSGLPNIPVNCVVYESGTPNGVFVGTDQGVYYKDTTMATWQFYNTNLPLVMVANLEIWNPIAPTASFTATPTTVCNGNSVQFTDETVNSPARQLIAATYGRGSWATPIEAAPALSWAWTFTGGGASPATSTLQDPLVTFTAVGTCTVTLTVTNIAGSNAVTKNSYITVVADPTVTATETTGVTCNGGNNGTASSTASSGTSPYTYAWSTGGTKSTVSGLTAGTYSISITDKDGCTASADVTITQAPLLSITATVTANVACGGGADGSISSASSGGTSPYTYSWTGGSTTANISGLSAGTYNVSLMDKNGCTATASATVGSSGSTVEIGIASQTNVLCNGSNTGSATADAASGGVTPYTYSWSSGGGTNLTASGLNAGTYTITATDKNGCNGTATATITQPTNALSASGSVVANTNCGDASGSASSAVSGGASPYTYSWTGGGTTPTISGLSAGTYNLSVSDNNGCTQSASVTITQSTSLSGVSANTSSNISCKGSNDGVASSTITGGTTPYTYSWTGGGTTPAISGLSAGTYNVSITDNNGCSGTATTTITQPANALSASGSVVANTNCGDASGSASSTVNGGTSPYTYSWTGGGTTPTISGLSAGTYNLSVSDNNGCTQSASVTITQSTSLSGVSANTSSNISCKGSNDGVASSTISGGTTPYTYSWTGGGTTPTISGLSAGTYNVSVTDNNGCSGTATTTITQPANALSASGSVTANASCAGNTGSASSTVNGGTSPYTYLWTGGGTTPTISGLSAGTYNLTVSDNNGCTQSASVTITQTSGLSSVSANATSNVKCSGFNDGVASSTVSGGTAPYTYSWTGGGTAPTISGLSAGTYNVNVTDKDGCSGTATITITQPNALNVSSTVTANVNCAGNTGSASSSVSGGTAPYTYAWTGGATTPDINGLSAGTYVLSLTDNNGCTASSSVTISQTTALSVSANTTVNVECNGFSDGSASSTVSGGASPYTYSWTGAGGGVSSTVTGLSAGIYMVTITDKNGCSGTAQITVTQPSGMIITVNSKSSTPGACNGQAEVTDITGGTAPYTYKWNNTAGSTTDTIKNECSGDYCCTITDHNGCTETTCVTIDNSTTGIATVDNASNINIYPDPNIGSFTVAGLIQGQVIELFNALGQQLSSITADKATMYFDISDKANGIYLVRILNKDGSMLTQKKIVKAQ